MAHIVPELIHFSRNEAVSTQRPLQESNLKTVFEVIPCCTFSMHSIFSFILHPKGSLNNYVFFVKIHLCIIPFAATC